MKDCFSSPGFTSDNLKECLEKFLSIPWAWEIASNDKEEPTKYAIIKNMTNKGNTGVTTDIESMPKIILKRWREQKATRLTCKWGYS